MQENFAFWSLYSFNSLPNISGFSGPLEKSLSSRNFLALHGFRVHSETEETPWPFESSWYYWVFLAVQRPPETSWTFKSSVYLMAISAWFPKSLSSSTNKALGPSEIPWASRDFLFLQKLSDPPETLWPFREFLALKRPFDSPETPCFSRDDLALQKLPGPSATSWTYRNFLDLQKLLGPSDTSLPSRLFLAIQSLSGYLALLQTSLTLQLAYKTVLALSSPIVSPWSPALYRHYLGPEILCSDVWCFSSLRLFTPSIEITWPSTRLTWLLGPSLETVWACNSPIEIHSTFK